MSEAALEHPLPAAEESTGSRIVRFRTKTPVYIVLVFVGLCWLVPTIVGSGALFRDMIAGLGRDLALGPQEARLRAVLDAELAR